MSYPARLINRDDAALPRTFYLSHPSTPPRAAFQECTMRHNPPPRHWPWFAAVIGMALLATIAITSVRDPPAVGASQPDEPPASSVSCDHRNRLCEYPLN